MAAKTQRKTGIMALPLDDILIDVLLALSSAMMLFLTRPKRRFFADYAFTNRRF
jgi:hypothetical protein